MGCCISHNPKSNSHPLQTYDTTHLTILEEEVIVKEVVLSETPKITKPHLSDSPLLLKSPITSCPQYSPKRSEKVEEISELDLSLSGISDFLSFSAIDDVLEISTATMRREKEEDEEEQEVVGPPVYALRKKSYSDDFSRRRGKLKSPEQSSRFVSPARGNVGTQRRRIASEATCRKKDLPGARRPGDGDVHMLGKGVTVRNGAPPGCRSMDANAVKSRRVVEELNDVVPGAVVESLENPLVSLECFIFL